jgi:hypothetical protein
MNIKVYHVNILYYLIIMKIINYSHKYINFKNPEEVKILNFDIGDKKIFDCYEDIDKFINCKQIIITNINNYVVSNKESLYKLFHYCNDNIEFIDINIQIPDMKIEFIKTDNGSCFSMIFYEYNELITFIPNVDVIELPIEYNNFKNMNIPLTVKKIIFFKELYDGYEDYDWIMNYIIDNKEQFMNKKIPSNCTFTFGYYYRFGFNTSFEKKLDGRILGDKLIIQCII